MDKDELIEKRKMLVTDHSENVWCPYCGEELVIGWKIKKAHEAQLRKAISIIEAEARKAERERIIAEIQQHSFTEYGAEGTMPLHQVMKYSFWQALKGEDDG